MLGGMQTQKGWEPLVLSYLWRFGLIPMTLPMNPECLWGTPKVLGDDKELGLVRIDVF
jgi:hypothetical protein